MSILSNLAKNREKSGDFFPLVKKNRSFFSTCGKKPEIFFHLWKKKTIFQSPPNELKNGLFFHNVVTIEQSYMFNTHFQLKVRSLNLAWNSFFWPPLALECYTSLRRASPYFALLRLAALGFAICFARLARLRSV